MHRDLDFATSSPIDQFLEPSKPNGFVVYTRNKSLKSSSVNNDDKNNNKQSNQLTSPTVPTTSRESDLVEVEVKLMEIETENKSRNSSVPSISRRFPGEGEEMGEIKDVEVMMDEGGENVAFDEAKKTISKKVVFKGRPSTVIELFETGLLEDYPVFYNDTRKPVLLICWEVIDSYCNHLGSIRQHSIIITGHMGKACTILRQYPVLAGTSLDELWHVDKGGNTKEALADGSGIILRGTIKDIGILCFCKFCLGAKVIPPSQFEIHAIKTYKRASEYICFENGKSLLDVVKKCSKCSLKALQETIQTLVGPMPEMESIVCRNCKETFWATSSAKMGQVCDACVIHVRRETNAIRTWREANPINGTYAKESMALFEAPKSVDSVPAENSMIADEHTTPKRSRRRRKKRKFLELSPVERYPGRSSVRISSRMKSPLQVTESVALFEAPKCVDSVPVEKSKIAAEHMAPKGNRRGRKKIKFMELSPIERSPERSSVRISSRMKVPVRVTERLSRSAPVSSPTRSTSVNKLMRNDSPPEIVHRSLNSISTPSSPRSSSRNISASPGVQWKISIKDQRMHKVVFEEGGLPDGTEVAYYLHGKKLLKGYKKGGGIFCFCCSTEVNPSTFEAHAGWASRRKPYFYIYTSNGVSLHELAISLLKGRTCSAKGNDDLCTTCADGGKLVFCDGCPRAFHRECASLSSIPCGKWYCEYCHNMFQSEKHVEYNKNALAAGRMYGIDPLEQTTKRLIRVVRNPEVAEIIACAICRGYDFSRFGFGPRTVILCDQCEKEYHIGCLKKSKVADLKELPKGKWFCCTDCKRIHSSLEYLLTAGAETLPDSCLDVIKKKHQDQLVAPPADLDVRWRLLSSKETSRESRLLLSEAVAIFHECFDPILDSVTGHDFIPSMVYGRNIRGQDFSGMYCAILTVNSTVVAAGILRIFGQDFAEVPLVATRTSNQGKGYFRSLFSCIEQLLAFLNVRTFVLPAADETESLWLNKFGFRRVPLEQILDYRKTCWQMVCFKGTSMLEKTVPTCRIIHQDEADSEVLEQ